MLLFLFLLLWDTGALVSSFSESLDIRPINQGLLIASFNFVQTIKDEQTINDYGTFPADIHSITTQLEVEELRISFGRGRWDYKLWGLPSFTPVNTGIQLHAWFRRDSDCSVDSRWTTLTQTLSGLLCASLTLFNDAKTSSPQLSFVAPNTDCELRYGVLPREAVCTENLTPWVKMLPCMSNVYIIYFSAF